MSEYCKECGHRLPDTGEYVIQMECGNYYPDDYDAASDKRFTSDTKEARKFLSYDDAYEMYYTPGQNWGSTKIIKLDEKQT